MWKDFSGSYCLGVGTGIPCPATLIFHPFFLYLQHAGHARDTVVGRRSSACARRSGPIPGNKASAPTCATRDTINRRRGGGVARRRGPEGSCRDATMAGERTIRPRNLRSESSRVESGAGATSSMRTISSRVRPSTVPSKNSPRTTRRNRSEARPMLYRSWSIPNARAAS